MSIFAFYSTDMHTFISATHRIYNLQREGQSLSFSLADPVRIELFSSWAHLGVLLSDGEAGSAVLEELCKVDKVGL